MPDLPHVQQEYSSQPPELAILYNSAALHCLKRPQLVKLCKSLQLSAKGKNAELIKKLEGKGKQLESNILQEQQQEESWTLIGKDSVPTDQSLTEFGLVQRAVQGSMSSSGSNGSLASTIRSAGNKLRNTFTTNHSTTSTSSSSTTRPTIESIYPSLSQEIAQLDVEAEEDGDKTLEFQHSVEGGIRRVVSTRTSYYAPSTTSTSDLPLPMTSTPAPPTTSSKTKNPFVFGSPIASNSPFEFSIMPGSLLDMSTTSDCMNTSMSEVETGKTTAELLVEEMNRRARETRMKAEKDGIRLGGGGGDCASGKKAMQEGGMFDGKHKRVFDARLEREHSMDSITNHYAAKRPHPSSSSNLAQLANSTTSPKKPLATSTLSAFDRPVKRVKPSKSSANLVSALREEGWTSTSNLGPGSKEKKVMSSSIGSKGTMGSMSLSEKVRERQDEREREREERKRRFELAKARRKSGATPVKARGRGKSSATTEAKPPIPSTSSAASQFLKSTFRKLTHSTSNFTTSQPLPSSSSSSSISQIPRFAASTASSSTRAGLVHSHSVRSIAPLRAASPVKKKEPGWKKFDLQESLKRGMSWKSSISGGGRKEKATSLAPISDSNLTKPSASLPRSDSSSLSRQPSSSSRVANPTLLPGTTSRVPLPTSQSIQSIRSKLDALPPAPKTPFTPLTNSTVGKKGGEKGVERERKVVSSVSKRSRGLKQVEGLEGRARKVRAVRKAGAGNGTAGGK
ncbi:hypothetical protein JCM5353_001520 [Sporobolomyces roseus]